MILGQVVNFTSEITRCRLSHFGCIHECVTSRIDPTKPEIAIPDAERKDVPIGDGSPVAVNIGDNVTAASNTTITLKCPVSGVPTPTVTWNKDGAEVTEGGRYFFSENNSLVIKGARVEDSADYFCVIQSAFGKEQLSSQVIIKGNGCLQFTKTVIADH